MSEEERQEIEDQKRVKEALAILLEHFDSVDIFVTRHEPVIEGTVGFNLGKGNWYARKGVISE